jgi:hypothetical protein
MKRVRIVVGGLLVALALGGGIGPVLAGDGSPSPAPVSSPAGSPATDLPSPPPSGDPAAPSPAPASGAPSASPLVAVAPSDPPGDAPSPGVTGDPSGLPERWAPVRGRVLRSVGPALHAVEARGELIAVALDSDRRGQTVLVTLASADGGSWTRRSVVPLTGSVSDLVADRRALYLVGWDEGPRVWRSTDAGRTWRPADPATLALRSDGGADPAASLDVRAIARGPAGLLAVGARGDAADGPAGGVAWRSANGRAWQRAGEVEVPLLALAADPSIYVAVASGAADPGGLPDGAVSASPDPAGSDPAGSIPPGTGASAAGGSSTIVWSTDGVTWTPAAIEPGPGGEIQGVVRLRPRGFLAWGVAAPADTPGAASPGAPASPGAAASGTGSVTAAWSSADGRTWQREPDPPGGTPGGWSSVRSVEGGALVLAVGRATEPGGWAWVRLPDGTWRQDVISADPRSCVRDVGSVRAILVAVGGACGAAVPSGGAWTSPIEP